MNICSYTQTYTEYVARADQSGIAPPTMNVLSNTIGPIVWTYVSPGIYYGHLNSAFPRNFTYLVANNGSSCCLEYDLRWINNSTIEYRTFSAGNASDGVDDGYITIRVY